MKQFLNQTFLCYKCLSCTGCSQCDQKKFSTDSGNNFGRELHFGNNYNYQPFKYTYQLTQLFHFEDLKLVKFQKDFTA